MRKTLLTIFGIFIWVTSGSAQHVFTPEGYPRAATFPGEYEVEKSTAPSTLKLFKKPYYKARYTSPDDHLHLSAIFGTYRDKTIPAKKQQRKKALQLMVTAMSQEFGGEFFMKKYYDIGPKGNGVSFTLSEGKGNLPLNHVVAMIIKDKIYVLSARLTDLKYQYQVLEFMKSATPL